MLDGRLLSRKGEQAHLRDQAGKPQQVDPTRIGPSAEDAHPTFHLHLRRRQLRELRPISHNFRLNSRERLPDQQARPVSFQFLLRARLQDRCRQHRQPDPTSLEGPALDAGAVLGRATEPQRQGIRQNHPQDPRQRPIQPIVQHIQKQVFAPVQRRPR